MRRSLTLLFLGAVVLGAQVTQAAQNPCLEVQKRVDFGTEWRSWTNTLRTIYLDGFMSGQSSTFLAVYNDLPVDRREVIRKATFLFYDIPAIAAVMTDLYKDPANTFIRHGAMVYIARDKLSGRDAEPMLRYSRENDCGFTERPLEAR
jgi:hypothetical protein